jgi:uncharacterized cupredoxin-like copper-binding protein
MTQPLPRRIAARAAVFAAASILITAVPLAARWAPGTAAPQTIHITMRHSRFVPPRLYVRPGTTVRFIVTNEDPIDHELILGDEAVQRRHETGTEPVHGAVPGEVSVPAGAVAEMRYTFFRAGVVLMGCHAPGHYAYGMRGEVLVGY